MDWVWAQLTNLCRVLVCTYKTKEFFCVKSKKDNLMKHKPSAHHSRSTLILKHQLDLVTANVTANGHAKSAIITQVKIVRMQVKHCLSTVKNEARVKFQILNLITTYSLVEYRFFTL